MYEIRPESVYTFITDRNVKLPRFQRKQTWDKKKNFQLCISVFKEYPIGVCILSVSEDTKQNKKIRWLLDGRQRRNALTQMYEEPENIYDWAKSFIKFKANDQPDELADKYWEKVNEYLEADDYDGEVENQPSVVAENSADEDTLFDSAEKNESDEEGIADTAVHEDGFSWAGNL